METVSDIVAEMRRGFDRSWRDVDREWAHGLADRIEAAERAAAAGAECEYLVEIYHGSRPGWAGLTRVATLDEARDVVQKRIDNGWSRDAYRIVKVTREVVG